MQNAEWIALLRQIPKEMHSQLILVAQNRSELSVETIFRMEANFLVLRGRISGTTDGGLLFLFPYDQLSTICLNRELKEEDVQRMFENMVVPAAKPLSASQQGANGTPRLSSSKQGAPTRPSATPGAVAAPAPVRPSGDPSSVARNNLLERLRAARNAAMPPAAKQ